jgi:hypothetical protein
VERDQRAGSDCEKVKVPVVDREGTTLIIYCGQADKSGTGVLLLNLRLRCSFISSTLCYIVDAAVAGCQNTMFSYCICNTTSTQCQPGVQCLKPEAAVQFCKEGEIGLWPNAMYG